MGWAHEGTVESIEKIRAVMLDTQDDEVIMFAQLAYDEALFNVFSPKTDEDERDFLFGRMIHRSEAKMLDLAIDRERFERLIAEDDINKAVHEKILKSAKKKEREEWKFHWSKDHSVYQRIRLAEVLEDLAYTKAWLEEAKKLFTSAKYKGAPDQIYESIRLDSDGGDCAPWDDDAEDEEGEPS